MGVSFFVGVFDKNIPEIETSTNSTSNLHSISYILIGFGLSLLSALALFWVLFDLGWFFTDVTPMPVKYIPANLVYQLVIVVCSEEIIFRGVLYRYFTVLLDDRFSIVITSVLFSLFHSAVYGFNPAALMMAFVMGLLFALCVRRWNIGVPIGLHLAWNGMVLGIFVLA